ncbi:FAD-dependent oxidoreductase [Paraburkholderia dipogonis]|uniref:FAD-dependent oxidoreductase n=1 Tax=Paraburkholderia dipogonis TaxID=1211383 RepID=A0A4Y8MGB5_9BURK|nr:FAD-binding protein [Paraburkholderia dipogonis]TFE36499.1 FAD-dependent oxidoreductase [Paraburkholderia dipogonis]
MTTNTKWDREVDLLVLGAGAGGMTAALVASLEGLTPLVIEKSRQVGGTASTSAGSIWIPGNRQSLDAGYPDSAEAADVYMEKLSGRRDDSGLRQVYLQTGPRVVDYLRAKSDVRFNPCGKHPDYRDLDGAAVSGRALVPENFDGRLLGADFERVRPPIPEFMVLSGMMAGKEDIPRLLGRFKTVSNFMYSGKLFARYVFDRTRYSRGTRVVMGNALVARLFYSLKKRKVEILFESTVTELVRDGNAVIGAVVRTGSGNQRVRTRKGVVLATGGYGHNRELRKQFMPRPTPQHSVASESNTGDGITLGLKYGASVRPEEHGDGAFWTPVSITRRPDGTKGLFPHLSLDRAKPGLIAVNSAGKRFVNEAASYHDFVQGMYASHPVSPTMPAYLICETGFITRYGLGAIYPGTRNLSKFESSGYLITGSTLDVLAEKLKIRPDALQETVERYNQFARNGKDLDFGKGDTELNRFNGDSKVRPNPCLAEIRQGPFTAVAVYPAEIATSTGLRTNGDGQVLDEKNRVVAGLYACGNDMASVMLGTYPGPGTTLGPALTFGYRVAMNAAGKSDLAVTGTQIGLRLLPTLQKVGT